MKRYLLQGQAVESFYNAAAGCRLRSAAVIAYASAGEFARFNPHLHAIVLEGGFDPSGRFLHVPRLDLSRLSQYFRSSMIAFFLKRQLINKRLAPNMLQWDHSGFSVDGSVRIPAGSSRTREALSQYIARAPVSLSKLVVEEHAATVLYHAAYNPYFRTNRKVFPCHRPHRRVAATPPRPSLALDPSLRVVLFPLPRHVAAQAPPGAPRS